MADQILENLKLTAGVGITLQKGIDADSGKLFINATNDSNTKIYYHEFTNSTIGLVITDDDCIQIFAEAAEQGALILIKIKTSSAYGSGDSLYVYDGKYTPGASVTPDPYTELGFFNSYVSASDSSLHTNELTIRRTGTEGNYTYSHQMLTGASGSGSQSPVTVYTVTQSITTGEYKFDELQASDISAKVRNGGNVIICLVQSNGNCDYIFYSTKFTTGNNPTVEFRTVKNKESLELSYNSTTNVWAWKFVNNEGNFEDKVDLALNVIRLQTSGNSSDYWVYFPKDPKVVEGLDGIYLRIGTGGTSGFNTPYQLYICELYKKDSTSTPGTDHYYMDFRNVTYTTGVLRIHAHWYITNGDVSTVTWSGPDQNYQGQ